MTTGKTIEQSVDTGRTQQAAKTSTASPEISAGKASLLDQNTVTLLKDFTDRSATLSAENKKAILDLLTKANQELVNEFRVADNVVIADFYVPYLCCSDCPPVAYILQPQEKPPPVETEFDIASSEYLFDDAHNYPFTTKPPVTDKNKAQVTFSSANVINPGNLNLLTDDNNTLYLHPAMPDLSKTFTTTITYENIPLNITIIRPDATFTITEIDVEGERDAAIGAR